MKRLMALALVLVSTITACGGEPERETPAAGPASEQPSASPSPEPSTPMGGDDNDGSDGKQVLTGMVGEPDDAEAFTITLEDSSGKPVKTLPAGDYQVKISDPAKIHNFHLTGPGVDESTTVPGTEDVMWDVTLERGSYTFVCDPHPNMVGTFKVT